MSLRDAIFAENDLHREWVDVPEWPNVKGVWIQAMSAAEAIAFGEQHPDGTDMNVIVADLIVACVVDEHGNKVFQPDDVERLKGKSNNALKRIGKTAVRINLLDAKSVGVLAKNSEGAGSDNSPSGSQGTSSEST